MTLGVKKKFDEYLGEINKLVFIASVFDPRKKFSYLHVTICNMFGDDDGGKLVASCRKALFELFDDYKRIHFDHGMSSTSNDAKSELDRYLTEDIEDDKEYFKSKDFNVLDWWKKRSTAFPILSLVARDVLAMPISTVACESSFSTKGRVLDSFRTVLPSETIQALVCCEDWFRSGDVPINVEKHIQELDKYEYDTRETLSEASDVDA